MQCTVQGCRYSTTHNTSKHQCGKCHQYGHGRMECGTQHTQHTQFVKLCFVEGCRHSTYHKTVNHQCGKCHQYGHGQRECGNQNKIIALHNTYSKTDTTSNIYAISEAQKLFGNRDRRIFGTVYAGMGCNWYVKRDSVHSPISAFFMHSDSWGQYGIQCDDRPKLIAFCTGYINITDGKPLNLS